MCVSCRAETKLSTLIQSVFSFCIGEWTWTMHDKDKLKGHLHYIHSYNNKCVLHYQHILQNHSLSGYLKDARDVP